VTIFIDSGGWLSVLIESDRYHEAGKAYFQAMIEVGAPAVTTDFVLDEVLPRLRYDVGHAKAAEFLALIHGAAAGNALHIHRITEDLWNKAEVIFLRYADVRLSFTDCTSFAWLSDHSVDEVFGYDSHFEIMGHILQPKPM
jgi:predicted nucleic acid-binding protein